MPTTTPLHSSSRIPAASIDPVDVAAGMREAAAIGYDSPNHQMVVEYAMARWARGEEEGAMDTLMSGGIDLTSAYRICAAALSAARAATQNAPVDPDPTETPALRSGQALGKCCEHCAEDPGYHADGSKDDHTTSCTTCDRTEALRGIAAKEIAERDRTIAELTARLAEAKATIAKLRTP